MSSIVYMNIRVKQSLSVHPLTHVQLLGAVHCLLVPQGELQIAILLEDVHNEFNCIYEHTC